MKKTIICEQHCVFEGDFEHLEAPGAKKYNHCLDCAIKEKPAGFTRREIAELMGLHSGQHVQLIETSGKKNFVKAWKRMFPNCSIQDCLFHSNEEFNEERFCSIDVESFDSVDDEDYCANDSL